MKQGNSFLRLTIAVICIWLIWPTMFLVLCGTEPPHFNPVFSFVLAGVVGLSVNYAAERLLSADHKRTEAAVNRLDTKTWDDLSYVLDIRDKYFSGPIFDAAGRAIARLLEYDSADPYVNLTMENRKTLVAELEPEQCYTHPEIVLAILKLTDAHALMEAKVAVDRLSKLNAEDRRIRGIVLLARSTSVKFVKQASLEAKHKHLLRPTEPTDTFLRPREGFGSEPPHLLVRPALACETLDIGHTE
jgi:hypothetical protein